MVVWPLCARRGNLIDHVQRNEKWSLIQMLGTYVSLAKFWLLVYMWSMRVLEVQVIRVGVVTNWLRPKSETVDSQAEWGLNSIR